MKKTFILLLAVAILFSACGNEAKTRFGMILLKDLRLTDCM